jgi:large subunit ribosomal protein L29
MKIDELVVLERHELGDKLRASRRELYELRFRNAVGQLENKSQIAKVRKDIARILTVLRQRDFGVLAVAHAETVAITPEATKQKKATKTVTQETDTEEEEES